MCRLLKVSMAAGDCGFSLQYLGVSSHQRDYDGTPMLTDTMSQDDPMEFAHVLKKLGYGVIQGIGQPGAVWERLAEVSGRPVEDGIAAQPGVSRVAVIGLPDPSWGEAVTAVVVASGEDQPTADALIAAVRAEKGPVQAPKRVIFGDAIPLSAAGKPDKKALRERFAAKL